MRAVVQRVLSGSVAVAGEAIGAIGHGLVVLIGVAADDSPSDVAYMVQKIAGLRVFGDDLGRMNLSVAEVGGEVLLISQFTLLADARGGRRPSLAMAAKGDAAEPIIAEVAIRLRLSGLTVREGSFGADMQVSLVNDGPVTILLDSRKVF